MKKFQSYLSLFFLLAIVSVNAQMLKGTVVDETGALPGANVFVKGTTTGMNTDFDGNFSFDAKVAKGEVMVSFVGYTSTVVAFDGINVDLGTIVLKPSSVGLEEVMVMASFAIGRKTPVAVSTIKAEAIELKLGAQEFPEILKATPGVYVTKTGGGYGDSRINLRGFNSENVGVMINGIPVNDMENGRVYWSNWAGLNDVTSSMQVQRGLGASKIAVPSVGGTINIVTKTTDAEQGGVIRTSLGNNGNKKSSFTYSSGLQENGLATTVSMSKLSGDGYVQGTPYEGFNYFLNVSKVLNTDHKLAFSVFGAQQVHGQRFNRLTIPQYRATNLGGRRLNLDWGYRNGQMMHTSYNYYHKPQMSLNHFWTINEKMTLNSSVYASFGTGGGRRTRGTKFGFGEQNYRMGGISDQPIDFDMIAAENTAAGTAGSSDILYNSVNNHQWFGAISTFNYDITEDLVFTTGIDARYYIGEHYYEVYDLLGGSHYEYSQSLNSLDAEGNEVPRQDLILRKGDRFSKDNVADVLWGGLFGQLEYTMDDLTVFGSAAINQTIYSKVDNLNYLKTDPARNAATAEFFGYNMKGGANYNIDDAQNVFVNGGIISRAPFLRNVYESDFSNNLNPDAINEKVFSAELGYGFKSSYFTANVNAYRTYWMDKSLSRTRPDAEGNIIFQNFTNINAMHQGLEMDFTAKITKQLSMTGMVSLGDWNWISDGSGQAIDQDGNILADTTIYADGLKVGNSAQTTFAAGLKFKADKKTSFTLDWNYAGKNYADFNIDSVTSPGSAQPWEMPEFNLFDLGASHKFKFADLDAQLSGNLHNIFNTEYISDARGFSVNEAIVYYGAGRTFNLALKVKF